MTGRISWEEEDKEEEEDEDNDDDNDNRDSILPCWGGQSIKREQIVDFSDILRDVEQKSKPIFRKTEGRISKHRKAVPWV